jgi:hypothetical protein
LSGARCGACGLASQADNRAASGAAQTSLRRLRKPNGYAGVTTNPCQELADATCPAQFAQLQTHGGKARPGVEQSWLHGAPSECRSSPRESAKRVCHHKRGPSTLASIQVIPVCLPAFAGMSGVCRDPRCTHQPHSKTAPHCEAVCIATLVSAACVSGRPGGSSRSHGRPASRCGSS